MNKFPMLAGISAAAFAVANEGNGNAVSAVEAHRQVAASFADIINKDDAAIERIDSYLDAKEETQTGALFMAEELKRILPAEKLDALPVPNSEGGNNPDKYEAMVKNTDTGESKPKKGSFYRDLAASLVAGKEILSSLEDLAKVKAKDPEAPEEMRNMTAVQQTSLRNRLNGRMTALVSLLKRTANLIMQVKAANELPGVLAKVIMVKDHKTGKERITTSPYPIAVFDKADTTKFQVLSVSSFLAFDVDEAAKNGGTYEALTATSKRAGSEGGSTTIEPFTVDTFEEFTAEAAAFVASGKNEAKLIDALNKDEAYLISFGDMCMAFDNVWSKIEGKYKAAKLKEEAEARKVA